MWIDVASGENQQTDEGFANSDTSLDTVKKALEARMNVIEGASWSGK
jgi:hypothetical protein